MSTSREDSMKFWAILTVMLLAVAVIVTFVDLTIKASILAESNSLKLAIEDWEVRYGFKQAGRSDQGNSADNSNNGHFPGDVLATGDAGLAAGSLDKADKTPAPKRERNGRFASSSDSD